MISEIIVVRRGRVRRAKLYYLRHLTGKATRIRERKAKVTIPGSETVVEAWDPRRALPAASANTPRS